MSRAPFLPTDWEYRSCYDLSLSTLCRAPLRIWICCDCIDLSFLCLYVVKIFENGNWKTYTFTPNGETQFNLLDARPQERGRQHHSSRQVASSADVVRRRCQWSARFPAEGGGHYAGSEAHRAAVRDALPNIQRIYPSFLVCTGSHWTHDQCTGPNIVIIFGFVC